MLTQIIRKHKKEIFRLPKWWYFLIILIVIFIFQTRDFTYNDLHAYQPLEDKVQKFISYENIFGTTIAREIIYAKDFGQVIIQAGYKVIVEKPRTTSFLIVLYFSLFYLLVVLKRIFKLWWKNLKD